MVRLVPIRSVSVWALNGWELDLVRQCGSTYQNSHAERPSPVANPEVDLVRLVALQAGREHTVRSRPLLDSHASRIRIIRPVHMAQAYEETTENLRES